MRISVEEAVSRLHQACLKFEDSLAELPVVEGSSSIVESLSYLMDIPRTLTSPGTSTKLFLSAHDVLYNWRGNGWFEYRAEPPADCISSPAPYGYSFLYPKHSLEVDMDVLIERTVYQFQTYAPGAENAYLKEHPGAVTLSSVIESIYIPNDTDNIPTYHPVPCKGCFRHAVPPIQLRLDGVLYEWKNSGWFYASEDTVPYPFTTRGPYDIPIYYPNIPITLTDKQLSDLRSLTHSQFRPDVVEQRKPRIIVIDGLRNIAYLYDNKGGWIPTNDLSCSLNAKPSAAYITVDVEGVQTMPTENVITLLLACRSLFDLCNKKRAEKKDYLISQTVFRDWDTACSYIDPHLYSPKVYITTKDVESLLLVERNGSYFAYSKFKWHKAPTPLNKSRDGFSYTLGSYPVHSLFIQDYLNFTADMEDEVTIISYMLGYAKEGG